MRIVGEIADLVDGEERWSEIASSRCCSARAVSCRVRSRIRSAAVRKRAEWPARIASWTRFLAIIVLPRPCDATTMTFSRWRKSSVRTRSTVGRWIAFGHSIPNRPLA